MACTVPLFKKFLLLSLEFKREERAGREVFCERDRWKVPTKVLKVQKEKAVLEGVLGLCSAWRKACHVEKGSLHAVRKSGVQGR